MDWTTFAETASDNPGFFSRVAAYVALAGALGWSAVKGVAWFLKLWILDDPTIANSLSRRSAPAKCYRCGIETQAPSGRVVVCSKCERELTAAGPKKGEGPF